MMSQPDFIKLTDMRPGTFKDIDGIRVWCMNDGKEFRISFYKPGTYTVHALSAKHDNMGHLTATVPDANLQNCDITPEQLTSPPPVQDETPKKKEMV
jgi:hypothetical protein